MKKIKKKDSTQHECYGHWRVDRVKVFVFKSFTITISLSLHSKNLPFPPLPLFPQIPQIPIFQSLNQSMEFFTFFKSVKLRSHLHKYLTATHDHQTVRQTTNPSATGTIWAIEFVEGKTDSIRLRSRHGNYLSATDLNFLLGATGRKVICQTKHDAAWSCVEWEPVRDGDRVKLMSWCGSYLRGNGAMPPWRNSVTHDEPRFSSTKGWILWDVEPVVEIPNYCLFMTRRSISTLSSSSSKDSEHFSVSGKRSPSTPKSVRRSSTLQVCINFKFLSYISMFP